MTTNLPGSVVLVHTSSRPFEVEVVKAMLAEEDIPCMVENENGPFPGMASFPCKVYVATEHEGLARQLIEEHEAQHRQRLAEEENVDELSDQYGSGEEETAEFEATGDE